MMQRICLKRLLCFMCVFLFLSSVCQRAAAEIADGLFSEQPFSWILSAQFGALAPFEEARLAQWNALIKHISLKVDADSGVQMCTVLVDEDKAFSLARASGKTGDTLYVDTLPYLEFTADPELLHAFMGSELLPGIDDTFDAVAISKLAMQLCDEAFALYRQEMTEKKEKQVVKGYGNTTHRLTLSGDAFSPWMEKGTQLLPKKGFFSGKQTLYYLVDDDDAFYKCGYSGSVENEGKTWEITASVKLNKQDSYEIAYTAIVHNEKKAVTDKVVWTFGGKQADDIWSGDTTLTIRHGKEQTVYQCNEEFTSTGNDVRGEITYREGNKTSGTSELTVVMVPELTIATDIEGKVSSLGGTVSVRALKEKAEVLDAILSVTGEIGNTDFSLVSTPRTQIDIGTLTPAERATWRERITQSCAAAMLREIVYIDVRDVAWIRDGLDDLFWEDLIRKSGPLVKEDEDR